MNRRTVRAMMHGGMKGKRSVHTPMPKAVIQEGLNKIFLPPPKTPTILENLGFGKTNKKKAKKNSVAFGSGSGEVTFNGTGVAKP